jgi:uncharacterized protein (TIGR00255 family)
VDDQDFLVEIRSLNHRNREITVRLPRFLSHMEDRAREIVQERLERGRITVNVSTNGEDGASNIRLNESMARRYVELARSLKTESPVAGELDINAFLNLPDVLVRETVAVDEEGIWKGVAPLVERAIDDFLLMREKEGEALARDLAKRAQILREALGRIENRLPEWMSEGKARLTERIEGISRDADFNRFRIEAEIVLFVDRFDSTEEIVRLRSHLDQMLFWIDDPKPAGRKLGFLVQELQREANTIGSKAQDITITKDVMIMKEEIEKIREQTMNIE